MPNPIIPKSNLTPGVSTTPPAASLQTGELASNKFLGTLFIKKEDGTVVEIGRVKSVNGLAPNASGDITITASTVGAVASGSVGVANGVASLDSAGKVPASQLPDTVVGGLNYKGTWNAATNTPALASGTGTKGFYYKVSVAGTTNIDGNSRWDSGDAIAFNGTTWDKIDGGTADVLTVNNQTPNSAGNVQLTAANVGAVATTAVGAAGGVASLDAGGKVPAAQVPVALAGTIGGVRPGARMSVDAAGALTVDATVLNTDSTINGGTY